MPGKGQAFRVFGLFPNYLTYTAPVMPITFLWMTRKLLSRL
ncbi:hypothetical protein EC912_103406 [Luteibacter rhizovicinus]|uniref:Uncharacterized protein n=1 Tax=Luteibacter rhizovicinus TaxID=242606 RepID=A0A4R3YUM9_9GAMM|nr:hypothetical protein EC912_103406 [Luteibacter rhizovicinus]